MTETQQRIEDLITRDPHVLGGLPVFTGTRVPVRALFEHLEAGDSIETFVESFPNVDRKQAVAVIAAAGHHLLA